MKIAFLFLLFLIFGQNSSAQNLYLQITGSSTSETKIIDSISYIRKHKNTKSVQDEISDISSKLSKIGYIDNNLSDFSKANDSSYVTKLNLGKKLKFIHIYIGNDELLNNTITLTKKNNSIELPYSDTDSFLKETIQKLEQKGYALATLKLTNIRRDKNNLYTDLKLESSKKRKLNSITIQYSDNTQSNKFPKGHLTQINKKYNNYIFNQKTVEVRTMKVPTKTDFEWGKQLKQLCSYMYATFNPSYYYGLPIALYFTQYADLFRTYLARP